MSFFKKRTLSGLATLMGVFCFCTIASAAGRGWQVVGSPEFSSTTLTYSPIAISPTGTPYVAYEDNANNNMATVMKYDGSNWVNVGNPDFSAGQVNSISLAIDASGTPYVSYGDVANGNKATVMKYDGSSWVAVGSVGFSSGTTAFTSLAIDTNGAPYMAYTDQSTNYITVMKYNGSNWVTVGSPFTGDVAAMNDLVFSPSGTPYVAFTSIATGEPILIKFDGTNWIMVGTPYPGDADNNTVVAFNSNGTPYLAYSDINQNFYTYVLVFDGTNWVTVASPVVSAPEEDFTSLVIDANGTPYVGYDNVNDGKSNVIKYNGSSWVPVGDVGFSGDTATFATLVLSPSGTLYVDFVDTSNGDYKLTVMEFFDVPGQVTNLSATAQSTSSINLLWTAPTNNGSTAITGYQIERESPIGAGFTTLVANTGSTLTSYIDSSLTPSVTYNYRISAMNEVGPGTASNAANATTLALVQHSGGGGCSACASLGGTSILAPTPMPVPVPPTSTPIQAPISAPVSTFPGYTDLAKNDPDYDAFQYFFDQGIIAGNPDGTVNPNGNLQRDQVAKILVKALIPDFQSATDYCNKEAPFPDVSVTNWASNFICYGVMNHIITGYNQGIDAGYYRPLRSVTWAEFAVLVARSSDNMNIPSNSSRSYPNVPANQWYSGAAKYFQDQHVTSTFIPNKIITRREVVEVLYKLKMME